MVNRINEQIGAWLLDKGNTKVKLANILNVTRPTLDSRISGRTAWRWDEVMTLAELTGVTPNYFAGIPD